MTMSHEVACGTEIGRTHRVNQDAVGGWSWSRRDGHPATLLVVADGVSAGARSEEASQATVTLLRARLEPLLQNDEHTLGSVREGMIDAAREVSMEIARRPHSTPETADATTLVAVACVGRTGIGIWCGDSRVYHAAASRGITLMTRDHSWAEGVVGSGLMSHAEAASDPRARMITRWLGSSNDSDPGIEIFRFDLAPGETILCCSDGLSMYFAPPRGREDEMAAILNDQSVSLTSAVESLMALAAERGGRDDISVAALRLREE
jgi:protein phosphatase